MIDIERFICSLLEDHPAGVAVRSDIHKALKDQGLEYKDGKIVSIEDERVWLTKFIQEEIDCLRFDIRDCDDRIKLKNLQRSLAWLEKQSKESKVEQAMREVEKKAEAFTKAHKGETSEEILAQMRGEEKPAAIIPKFRVGDIIRLKGGAAEYTIKKVTDTTYYTDGWSCDIERCEEDYELVEQNHDWREEDERMYKTISIALSLNDAKGYLNSWYTTPEEADNWLKTLKERVQPQSQQQWKPSKEQMEAMQVFLEHGCAAPDREASLAEKVLELLYNDLKKLKEAL